jgi:hypothetical protein
MKNLILLLYLAVLSKSSTCQVADSLKLLNLTVTMAGKTKGDITKDELVKSTGLILKDSASKFHLRSFQLTLVTTEGNELKYYNLENGDLTEQMQVVINRTANIYKIYFESIKCADKNDSTYTIPAIGFKLKKT